MLREIVLYVNVLYPKYQHLEHRIIQPCVIKSALCYQWLHKKYFRKNLDLQEIIYCNDYNMGKIGPSDLTFVRRSKVMQNHAIFHDAFGRFYNDYYDRHGRLRGYCYTFNCRIKFLKKSPLFGHLTGIVYWLFNEGVC